MDLNPLPINRQITPFLAEVSRQAPEFLVYNVS